MFLFTNNYRRQPSSLIDVEEGEHTPWKLMISRSPSSRTRLIVSAMPQVTFASLSSPAAIYIRRLRRRQTTNDKVERGNAKPHKISPLNEK